jgi:hypothetical protein
MFAPPVATPKAKAASSSTDMLPQQRRNSAPPRLRGVGGAYEQEGAGDAEQIRVPDRGSMPAVTWDFIKIPLFPPQRSAPPPIAAPLPRAIQPKLAVGRADGPLEHEADHVARQVMRTIERPHARKDLRAANAEHAERPDDARQFTMRPVVQFSGRDVAVLSTVDRVADSRGQPLDSVTRTRMEAGFGVDFGSVRVHTDERASEAAHLVSAAAYTTGRHLVFAAGRYRPGTMAGDWLLAHELTHVLQQGTESGALQRQPDDKPQQAPEAKPQSTEETSLPFESEGVSFFEENSSGIRFLVGIDKKKEHSIRKAIPDIGKQIASDNSRIKDAADQITTCFIVPTPTRFALWQGKPTLLLDPRNANRETTAHEMGHAIFVHLQKRAQSTEKDAAKAGNFRLKIADIFTRLQQTKSFTVGKGDDEAVEPAGLWIADPSQWGGPGEAGEHPWDNAEEFFASAKAAFQINRKRFESAIARFTKIDPAVEAPAKELLALLDMLLEKGELPSGDLPEARAAAAQTALKGIPDASTVEEAVPSFEMNMLLNPGNRPKQQKRHP